MLTSNRQKDYINDPQAQITDINKTITLIYLTGFRLGNTMDTT